MKAANHPVCFFVLDKQGTVRRDGSEYTARVPRD